VKIRPSRDTDKLNGIRTPDGFGFDAITYNPLRKRNTLHLAIASGKSVFTGVVHVLPPSRLNARNSRRDRFPSRKTAVKTPSGNAYQIGSSNPDPPTGTARHFPKSPTNIEIRIL
jgi:hypothetical protein